MTAPPPDGGQWKRVLYKRTRRPGRRGPRPPAEAPLTGPPLTVDEIRTAHQRAVSDWDDEACSPTLKALVAARAASLGPITQAVCLGAGSFDPRDGIMSVRRRAHIETHVFLTIVDILGSAGPFSVPCPDYREASKQCKHAG